MNNIVNIVIMSFGKFFLLFIICFLVVPNAEARWYGSYWQDKTIGDGRTWCIEDGDITGGSPSFGSYSYDSRVVGQSGNNMRCQRWDAALPEIIKLSYFNGWTNSDQNITVEVKDRGGSRLKRILLQQSMNGGGWTDFGNWDNLTDLNSTIVTRNITRSVSGQNGNTFRYRVIGYDYAGNSRTSTSSRIIRIDTTAPLASDISNPPSSNLLANNSFSYGISVSVNGGSPINSVQYQRENSTTQNFLPIITDYSAPWSTSWNISRVDNYRVSNGSRQYSFRVRNICDEAGNCSDVNRNFNHNVYANTTSINSSIDSNPLSSPILADGSPQNIVIRLEDQYGNAIVPASGVGREIDFNIKANNNLRLNQYNNNGNDSAVFVGNNNTDIPVGNSVSRSLDNRFSSDGYYGIPFYVYSPTGNQYSHVPGNINITSITYDINRGIGIASGDNPQNQIISNTSFSIQSDPIYSSVFSRDIASQGFIEGVEQNSNIVFNYTPPTSTPSNRRVYFEFGSGAFSNNVSNARFDFSMNDTNIREGNTSSLNSTTVSGINIGTISSTVGFRSFLSLQDVAVNPNTNSYLASIIIYQIDGKTILYPSDIIGKMSYHGNVGSNNTYQGGVRILGNTSSSSTGEIVTDQFSNDVRILGNITKSSLKKDIETKVYGVIKNIPTKNSGPLEIKPSHIGSSTWSSSVFDIGNLGSQGTALFADKVLYFSGGDVNITGAGNIEGNKTIVVEGGNVRIHSNILNPDSDGTLGIIVLGGNIYIDTTVTDIHAILYTNKSIISYSPTKGVYDGSNLNIDDLKNQLYIKGSLFSENTIGGSKKSTPECPYYVTSSNCTKSTEAQIYDLNYLRRYYIYDSDDDGIPDTPSGNSSDGATGATQKHPVVIEYNPAIQSTPPPFFD